MQRLAIAPRLGSLAQPSSIRYASGSAISIHLRRQAQQKQQQPQQPAAGGVIAASRARLPTTAASTAAAAAATVSTAKSASTTSAPKSAEAASAKSGGSRSKDFAASARPPPSSAADDAQDPATAGIDSLAERDARGRTGGGEPLASTSENAPEKPKTENARVPLGGGDKGLSKEQVREVEEHNREFEERYDRASPAKEDKVDKEFWRGGGTREAPGTK